MECGPCSADFQPTATSASPRETDNKSVHSDGHRYCISFLLHTKQMDTNLVAWITQVCYCLLLIEQKLDTSHTAL